MKNFLCSDLSFFFAELHKDVLLTVCKSSDAYFKRNISMMIISLLLNSFVSTHSVSFQVNFYFIVYCALSGLCIISALVSTPSAQLAGSHSRRRLHDELVRAVMCNSLHFFQSTPFGRILNRFSYDMSIIDKV